MRTRISPPARRNVRPARMLGVGDDGVFERTDRLAAEEPMEIRAAGPGQDPVRVAVTMRTPGHDFELAVGFLFTEGLVRSPAQVVGVSYCHLPPEEQQYNVVTARLAEPFDAAALQRNFYATSSCGICGKASLEQVEVRCAGPPDGDPIPRSTIVRLPAELRRAQRIFEQTGGLHAAGLFASDGLLLALREDVGRHNALDKLVGWALLDGAVPLTDRVVLVSGRLGFELVQKAAVAGAPVLCAVSAPSSLAVEAGRRLGVTIVAFLRGTRFNVYTHPHRIDLSG